MAGNGPAPKANRQRARDTPKRETIKADGSISGFDLPEDLAPEGGEWHPRTRKMWAVWRASPQAQRMVTDVDWEFLLDTAMLHHIMWTKGRTDLSGELRIRMAKFGATPEDRLRLKLEVEVPENYAAGAAPSTTREDVLEKRKKAWGTTTTPAADTAKPGF